MPNDTTSSRSAVHRHLDAFNSHDTARLLSGFAADAVWTTGTDTFTGATELEALFQPELWTLKPALRLVRLIVDGPDAAGELVETLQLPGGEFAFAIAVFFRIHDGLISRAKVYREGSADIE